MITYPNINWVHQPVTTVWPVYIPQPIQAFPSIKYPSLAEAFIPSKAGTNSKSSHVVFILDDSASMSSKRDLTISGFNEFLISQKKNEIESGIETFISLFKFDGANINGVYTRTPVSQIPLLSRESYNPGGGGTNLLDAIGAVLANTNNYIASQKDKSDSIITVILTDGEENASRTFKNSDIKLMVSKAESANWAFMFLGAEIDAFAASSELGFSAHNSMSYTAKNSESAFSATTRAVNDTKTTLARGVGVSASMYSNIGFTDDERADATK